MTEMAIWALVIFAGVVALGLIEAVRSDRFASARWQQLRAAALAAALIIVTITSGILAVTWVVVVLLWDVWLPFLITIGVIAGAATLITMYFRQRSFFYASVLVLAAALMLIVL